MIRTDGGNGACEVTLTATIGEYTNYYATNYSGTNIYLTNFDGSGFFTATNVISWTNTFFTNVASSNTIQNDEGSNSYYLPALALYTVTQTNYGFGTNPPIIGPLVIGLPTMAGLGYPDFFTNFACVFPSPQITGPILSTNATPTNIVWTNIFCGISNSGPVIIPSASTVDFTPPPPQTLTFSNYQMAQDVYLPVNANSTGPDDTPLGDPLTRYIGINAKVFLTLSAPTRDPSENPDIAPPTISPSAGTAKLDILSYYSDPNNYFPNGYHTNNSTDGTLAALHTVVPLGMVSINWERSTFRVKKNVGTATVYIEARGNLPAGTSASYTVGYNIDYSPNVGLLNYNGWPTVA